MNADQFVKAPEAARPEHVTEHHALPAPGMDAVPARSADPHAAQPAPTHVSPDHYSPTLVTK